MNKQIPVKAKVIVERIPGSEETVLLDENHSQLLVLNDVGAGVWYLLDGQRTVSDIVREVRQSLPADAQEIEHDVSHFLADLEQRSLIHYR